MTKVPSTMKAAAIDRFGPADVLRLHTLPVPEIGPSEVLIAVHVAGIGFWDAKIRDGTWAAGNERFPLVMGTDGVGYIAAKGARVRRFDIGDRVWGYAWQNPKGGFYAEYVAVTAEHVAPAPRRLDLLQAGAGAVTGLTALQGIDDVLKVHRGETVLVFGASGAVGTLAVQFAKRKGAIVIGAASGRDGATLVRRLGAHAAFDSKRADAFEQLQELAPDGIDAVLVLAGGRTLERCLELVLPGGRIAYPTGVEPEPHHRRGIEMQAYDAAVGRRQFDHLDRAVTETKLRVPVAASYSLAQAARAHARIEKGHVLGRLALRVRSSR